MNKQFYPTKKDYQILEDFIILNESNILDTLQPFSTKDYDYLNPCKFCGSDDHYNHSFYCIC